MNMLNEFAEKILTIRSIYDHFHVHIKSPKPILNSQCTTLSFTEGNKWQLRDLSYFYNFPLEEIDISNSLITDIRALKSMPLKKLNLAKTQISSLSPLRDIKLEELNISDTKITDIRLLADMPLKVLNISHSKIRNLNYLSEFEDLEKIYLSDNQYKKMGIIDLLKQRNITIEIVPND